VSEIGREVYFILRQLLVKRERELRVVSLRCFRYLITNTETTAILKELHIDYLVIRFFEMEGRM
jgi:hypothetical protein